MFPQQHIRRFHVSAIWRWSWYEACEKLSCECLCCSHNLRRTHNQVKKVKDYHIADKECCHRAVHCILPRTMTSWACPAVCNMCLTISSPGLFLRRRGGGAGGFHPLVPQACRDHSHCGRLQVDPDLVIYPPLSTCFPDSGLAVIY